MKCCICDEIFMTMLIKDKMLLRFKVSKLGQILHVDKTGFLRSNPILRHRLGSPRIYKSRLSSFDKNFPNLQYVPLTSIWIIIIIMYVSWVIHHTTLLHDVVTIEQNLVNFNIANVTIFNFLGNLTGLSFLAGP